MTDVVDHEARQNAAIALQKIEAHERFCEERARKAEAFETEMRESLRDVNVAVTKGLTRIHERLDAVQRIFITMGSAAIIGFLGSVLWYLANK